MRSAKTLLLLFILFYTSVCLASIQVQKVVVGLDGYLRAERWVPLVFELYNSGDNFQGTLEVVKGETIFRKSIDLGAGAHKRVEVLYYHSNFYESLSYRILDRKGSVVSKDRLDPHILNYVDNLVLVISDSDYNHQFVNGQQNPWGGKTFIAYMNSGELFSDWVAYSSADAIALGTISGGETGFSRWQNLLQYAASGGVLVCSAGTGLSVLQHPALLNNLPRIPPESDRTVNAASLISRWAPATPGKVPVIPIPIQRVRARPCDRPLMILEDESSLVTSSPYYKGNIVYFAFDYTRLPEELRGIFARAWNDLIFPTASPGTPPTFGTEFRKRLEENPRLQKFLYDIPGLHLPDVKWFALFFFIYLLAIGPFQYILLRVLKKNSLLWITFPAIILLFTVTSFGYSQHLHSSESKVTQAAVVELFPPLNRQTLYQVYATAMVESGTFQFQAVPENSYLRKFVLQALSYQPEPYILSEDLPRAIQGETLKNWTFRTFDAVSSEPLSLPVRISLQASGKELQGRVINHGQFTIKESFFFYDTKNAVSTGSILPGASRTFSLSLNDSAPVPFAEAHLKNLLHLYNLSHSNPHFFFGQIEDHKGTLVVNGKGRDTVMREYVAIYVQIEEVGSAKPLMVIRQEESHD